MQPFHRCPYSLAFIFVVPLFSSFLMCSYTSVTDYSDTARSLSKEAPPSQQRILPVSTPDCLRASGSPTLCYTITPATTTPVHPISHQFMPRTVYDDVLVPPFPSILPNLNHETCRRPQATRPLHLNWLLWLLTTTLITFATVQRVIATWRIACCLETAHPQGRTCRCAHAGAHRRRTQFAHCTSLLCSLLSKTIPSTLYATPPPSGRYSGS